MLPAFTLGYTVSFFNLLFLFEILRYRTSWIRKSFQTFVDSEAATRRHSIRKEVLRNFAKLTGKHLCQSLFFNKVVEVCNFIKKETVAEMFSCEFCKISKTTFSYITLPVATSVDCLHIENDKKFTVQDQVSMKTK